MFLSSRGVLGGLLDVIGADLKTPQCSQESHPCLQATPKWHVLWKLIFWLKRVVESLPNGWWITEFARWCLGRAFWRRWIGQLVETNICGRYFKVQSILGVKWMLFKVLSYLLDCHSFVAANMLSILAAQKHSEICSIHPWSLLVEIRQWRPALASTSVWANESLH